MTLVDLQSAPDGREVELDDVGVSGLRVPITFVEEGAAPQPSVAVAALSVALPHDRKGTHMSRFVEVLGERRQVSVLGMVSLAQAVAARLDAKRARVELAFPVFVERAAPVSGARGLVDYDVRLLATLTEEGVEVALGVQVPVTSLCPCSKAISDYGAHNQRGVVSIEVGEVETGRVRLGELIEVAEANASCPVYAVLKRDDERFVTMRAYDHPVFVEDMVRGVASSLRADERVARFVVEAVNHESIHAHEAFARTAWRRPRRPG
jgi:GTP cyclohydrolase I